MASALGRCLALAATGAVPATLERAVVPVPDPALVKVIVLQKDLSRKLSLTGSDPAWCVFPFPDQSFFVKQPKSYFVMTINRSQDSQTGVTATQRHSRDSYACCHPRLSM